MAHLEQDLRFATRLLRSSPGFTVVVVLTLALAIGINSTVFSVVNLLLYPPIPFAEPERLVFVYSNNLELNRVRAPVGLADYLDLRERTTTLDDLAAFSRVPMTLAGTEGPVRLQGVRASSNFFQVAGIPAAIGRGFQEGDSAPGAPPVAILSDGAWQQHYGGDPAILGRAVVLDGRAHEIVGVLPATVESTLLGGLEVWTPLEESSGPAGPKSAGPAGPKSQSLHSRSERQLTVLGHLASGSTVAQTNAEIGEIARALAGEHPLTNANWSFFARPLRQALAGPNANAVAILMTVAVMVVLGIACVNVANLLGARSAARRHELSVRQAMGASRGRLVAQLLTESVLLAFMGGAMGLLVTDWTLRAMVAATGGEVAFFSELEIDRSVLLFTLTLSLLTPLVFALKPAIASARKGAHEDLKTGGRGGHFGRRGRARRILVAGQVTLTAVLLIVAGLAVRSVLALTAIQHGFEPDRVATFRVDLPSDRYDQAYKLTGFAERARDEIKALPGVRRAAWTSNRPILGGEPIRSFAIDGRPQLSDVEVPFAATVTVDSDFFDVLRIPLQRGRMFNTRDRAESVATAVISRATAERHWPTRSPIGSRIRLEGDGPARPWMEIVGVVGDIRNPDADQPPEPHIYLPLSQHPRSELSMVALLDADPGTFYAGARSAMSSVDSELALYDARSMRRILYDDLASDYVLVGLLSFFAMVALGMATAGVYSVIAYSVSQGRREIGVRMALGAGGWDVLRMVSRDGLRPVALGAALGILVGLGLARMMAARFYGVGATDPAVFLGVPGLLALVGVAAVLIPALRAARIDPMSTLRSE